jgi:hypothetical protein
MLGAGQSLTPLVRTVILRDDRPSAPDQPRPARYAIWGSPINLVTDITVLDNKPVEVDFYAPPVPRNIGLRMQYQESSEWCWIANGTSINHFYNPASTATQCQIMTIIGHNINKFPANTGASRPPHLPRTPPWRRSLPIRTTPLRAMRSTARHPASIPSISRPVA